MNERTKLIARVNITRIGEYERMMERVGDLKPVRVDSAYMDMQATNPHIKEVRTIERTGNVAHVGKDTLKGDYPLLSEYMVTHKKRQHHISPIYVSTLNVHVDPLTQELIKMFTDQVASHYEHIVSDIRNDKQRTYVMWSNKFNESETELLAIKNTKWYKLGQFFKGLIK